MGVCCPFDSSLDFFLVVPEKLFVCEASDSPGGGVLSCISYTGMCRPRTWRVIFGSFGLQMGMGSNHCGRKFAMHMDFTDQV